MSSFYDPDRSILATHKGWDRQDDLKLQNMSIKESNLV